MLLQPNATCDATWLIQSYNILMTVKENCFGDYTQTLNVQFHWSMQNQVFDSYDSLLNIYI